MAAGRARDSCGPRELPSSLSVTCGRSKIGGGDTGFQKLELVFGTLFENNADGSNETTGPEQPESGKKAACGGHLCCQFPLLASFSYLYHCCLQEKKLGLTERRQERQLEEELRPARAESHRRLGRRPTIAWVVALRQGARRRCTHDSRRRFRRRACYARRMARNLALATGGPSNALAGVGLRELTLALIDMGRPPRRGPKLSPTA